MEKNLQVINYINVVAEKKKVSAKTVIDALQDAIKKAYEKIMLDEVVEVKIDATTGAINLYNVYTVLDDATCEQEEDPETHEMVKVYNENHEMLLSEAIKDDKNATVGSTVKHLINLDSLDRRLVLQILQVFKQGVTIEANKLVYKEWIGKIGSIIYAEVEKIDSKSKKVYVQIGDDTFGEVPFSEQKPGEKLLPGSKYYFVIKNVLEQTKGWPIVLSRISGDLVKDLLHKNIPEIQTNVVEIVKVGRAAGFKTKVAVKSNQPGVDPIGACIGAKADRIRPIMAEMGGEKIEFVQWDEDFGKFLVNACNPAPIIGYKIVDAVVETDELGNTKEIERKKIILVVDDYKLALIIGTKGKNVWILSELLDANVEIMTLDEAKEVGLQYTKAEKIHYRTERAEKPKPVNKFGKTYDKYHSNATELLNSINETNDIVDNATIAKNAEVVAEASVAKEVKKEAEKVEEQPIVEEQFSELSEDDLSSYAEDLAAINELTKNDSKK